MPVTLLTGGLLGKYNFQICLVKFTLGTIYFKIASTEEPQSVVMFVCALGLCWIKGYFIWDWWNNQYLWHLGLLLNQKGRANNLHRGVRKHLTWGVRRLLKWDGDWERAGGENYLDEDVKESKSCMIKESVVIECYLLVNTVPAGCPVWGVSRCVSSNSLQ